VFAVVTGVDPAVGFVVADPSVAGVEPTVSRESVDAVEASSAVAELSCVDVSGVAGAAPGVVVAAVTMAAATVESDRYVK
jgi:hypothetical protein